MFKRVELEQPPFGVTVTCMSARTNTSRRLFGHRLHFKRTTLAFKGEDFVLVRCCVQFQKHFPIASLPRRWCTYYNSIRRTVSSSKSGMSTHILVSSPSCPSCRHHFGTLET
ncbi:hypothetical protein TNIN_366061 [Trichonephila inaurata madagascariensis]|uniref:Uncharacterized protein n=1 Tax=Trichonephila inaurata madagascariensis TaxID=2747483 RepID=A0A8X6IU86_9ARAC|nr:hypothetical protein TNIN_366061 [Trichonephila inaurata madagascariensis]